MSQLPTNCETKTKVDRWNRPLKCFKGQSIVPDILIKPSLKCTPFLSYKCESCNCKHTEGLKTWPPKECRGGNAYIVSWKIKNNCAFIDQYKCGEGIDAFPLDLYTNPSCIYNNKILKWSKELFSSKIAYVNELTNSQLNNNQQNIVA
jgi:hypothetical protein